MNRHTHIYLAISHSLYTYHTHYTHITLNIHILSLVAVTDQKITRQHLVSYRCVELLHSRVLQCGCMRMSVWYSAHFPGNSTAEFARSINDLGKLRSSSRGLSVSHTNNMPLYTLTRVKQCCCTKQYLVVWVGNDHHSLVPSLPGQGRLPGHAPVVTIKLT